VRAGIGINGLPILALEPDLQRYYVDNVIGGPGAFVVVAETYENFAEAVLKKLVTEVAAATGRVAPRDAASAGGGARQAKFARGSASRRRTTSMCWRKS